MKTKYFELTASEFTWNVSEEKQIVAWGFNQMIPGPTIDTERGDMIHVKVTNNLPEPTVIHWHGIQLPAEMDGTDSVQVPIAPGAWQFIVKMDRKT